MISMIFYFSTYYMYLVLRVRSCRNLKMLSLLVKFEVTLRLPCFGSTWVFGWDELHSMLMTRQSLLSSKTLDVKLLSKINEYITSRSKEISGVDDDGNDDGSIAAVSVFLYLLLAMPESPPASHTRWFSSRLPDGKI